MAKYGRVAEQNGLRFVPAVFSHTGQIHGEFKALVKEQIRHKLIACGFALDLDFLSSFHLHLLKQSLDNIIIRFISK